MDDPALEEDVFENEIIAELRDIRRWFAEQRAKYGMDWVDNSLPAVPNTKEAGDWFRATPPQMKQAGEVALTGPFISSSYAALKWRRCCSLLLRLPSPRCPAIHRPHP